MSFDIQKLRDITAPRGGLATAEKYQVSFFNLPSGLDISITNTLTFYCETVALPTKSISASDKMIYGTSYQMPYRHAFQELSMSFYLTDDMLVKIDRTSMANSLEVRVPFLDHNVVEFMVKCPAKLKYHGITSLKKIVY